MMGRCVVLALTVALLCCLVLAETEVDSFACEAMVGSYFYDLSALQSMNDNVYQDMGTRSEFYFAVCRDTFSAQCGGNPACTVDQHGNVAVMGELQFASWSSEYTAASAGIALVYEHGDNCDEFNKHSTTLIFHCDSTVDFYMYDVSEHYCGAIISIRSRHACPVSQGEHHHHDEESDSSSGHASNAWWITLTSIGGAALLCALLSVVVLAGVCVAKRVRKRSWASLPQDEEEAGKKWSQEDDIEFGRNSVPVQAHSATVLTPGYVPQGVETFTSPQYIQTMN